MKFYKSKIFIISFLFFIIASIFTFIVFPGLMPENIIIRKDETGGKWIPENYSWILQTKESKTSSVPEKTTNSVSPICENYNAKVYLCGIVPIKTVKLSVIDDIYVVPGGESIGITLKTKGILVVGTAPFNTHNSKKTSPAKDAGIKTGDIIIKADGIEFSKSEDLTRYIINSKGKIYFEGIRDGKNITWEVTPAIDKSDNTPKIGIWIRESVAGVGTVAFYSDNEFAALGHPIADVDTGHNVEISGGVICKADIIGIDKGKKGHPGSLKGVFSGDSSGSLNKNCYCGVFGNANIIPQKNKIKLAGKNEIKTGKAVIYCDIGNGTECFDIKISKIDDSSRDNKSMIVKVTDKKLLERTGGIVQGM